MSVRLFVIVQGAQHKDSRLVVCGLPIVSLQPPSTGALIRSTLGSNRLQLAGAHTLLRSVGGWGDRRARLPTCTTPTTHTERHGGERGHSERSSPPPPLLHNTTMCQDQVSPTKVGRPLAHPHPFAAPAMLVEETAPAMLRNRPMPRMGSDQHIRQRKTQPNPTQHTQRVAGNGSVSSLASSELTPAPCGLGIPRGTSTLLAYSMTLVPSMYGIFLYVFAPLDA